MKLEFQITLNDWLEFRRAEQSPFRLLLLTLADRAWIPLSFLLATSVLLFLLARAGVGSISFSAWPSFVILVLLALSRIYLSLPSLSRTQLVKNEWKKTVAGVQCKLELTETGFFYASGSSTYNVPWPEVGSVFQSEQLLMFCDEDGDNVLLIPKRAFASEAQREEFLEIAYQNTVAERAG